MRRWMRGWIDGWMGWWVVVNGWGMMGDDQCVTYIILLCIHQYIHTATIHPSIYPTYLLLLSILFHHHHHYYHDYQHHITIIISSSWSSSSTSSSSHFHHRHLQIVIIITIIIITIIRYRWHQAQCVNDGSRSVRWTVLQGQKGERVLLQLVSTDDDVDAVDEDDDDDDGHDEDDEDKEECNVMTLWRIRMMTMWW